MSSRILARLLVAIAVASACVAFLLSIRTVRSAAREMSCRNNLVLIGLALADYESTYGQLPLASEVAEDGRPWRSWRSHIYPTFLEQMGEVYDASTAWDSPTNLRLLDGTPIPLGGKDGTTSMARLARVPSSFACPMCAQKDGNGVNYVVVRGEQTAFPKSAPIKFSDITDGRENTLLVVESVTCTPDWTEPRDLDFETMSFTINDRDHPSISSLHRSDSLVLFADLAVYSITPSVTESELRALLTIAGGEKVSRDALAARGALVRRWAP